MAAHTHFLPGMSSHTPPLSFNTVGVGYSPVGGVYPAPAGEVKPHIAPADEVKPHIAPAGEGGVPIAGPNSTLAEGAPPIQGSGTAKRKGKAAAAKKADKSGDAPKGDSLVGCCFSLYVLVDTLLSSTATDIRSASQRSVLALRPCALQHAIAIADMIRREMWKGNTHLLQSVVMLCS